jgi:hypothetical protein
MGRAISTGTTAFGGSTTGCNGNGCGTVFKLDTTGHETILHRFTGTDGEKPYAGVVRDGRGNLYGSTLLGGAYSYQAASFGRDYGAVRGEIGANRPCMLTKTKVRS